MKNTSFKQILKEKNNRLFENLDSVKTKVTPILGRINENFIEYTCHDVNHSERVIEILDWMLDTDTKKNLNEFEIFFLLAACYLHDAGMYVSRDEKKSILKSGEFIDYLKDKRIKNPEYTDDEIFSDFIREIHHLRSEEFVKNNYIVVEKGLKESIGIDDKAQATIIGRICRGHRQEDLSDEEKFQKELFYKSNNLINMQFLSICLRLADEFDITNERTPLLLYKFVNPKKPVSKTEWEKHSDTIGIGKAGNKLKIDANCTNPSVHRALNNTKESIKQKLNEVNLILSRYSEEEKKKYKFEITDVDLKVEPEGYIYKDLKFTLNEKAIFNLLMGDKLYSDKHVCIRELLQNAIDTVRQKRKLDVKYKPNITFTLTEEKDELIVEDNGMGMNERLIELFFTNIGISYYSSIEYEGDYSEQKRIDSISQFGIGILSCFLIADKIVVETLAKGSDPLRLEIENEFDFFIVKKGRRKSPGTTVELILKKEKSNGGKEKPIPVNLKHFVETYASHVEFPITVIEGKNQFLIKDKGYDFEKDDLFNPFYRDKIKDIYFSTVEFLKEEDGIEGKIHFAFYDSDDVEQAPAYIREEWTKGSGSRRSLFNRFISTFSNLGILVSSDSEGFGHFSEDPLPRWMSGSFYTDLNFSGKAKLSLDLPRNTFIADKEFSKIVEKIEIKLLEFFESIFNDKWSQLDNYKKYYVSRLFLSRFTDVGHGHNISERFKEFINKRIVFPFVHNGEIIYHTLNEISELTDFIIDLNTISAEKFIHYNVVVEKNAYYVVPGIERSSSSRNDTQSNIFKAFFKPEKLIISDHYRMGFREFNLKEKPDSTYSFYRRYMGPMMKFSNQKLLCSNTYLSWPPLNKEHPFSKLISDNEGMIEENPEKLGALNNLFSYIHNQWSPGENFYIAEKDFKIIKKFQENILKGFVETGEIRNSDIKKLSLKKKDFPKWWFEKRDYSPIAMPYKKKPKKKNPKKSKG